MQKEVWVTCSAMGGWIAQDCGVGREQAALISIFDWKGSWRKTGAYVVLSLRAAVYYYVPRDKRGALVSARCDCSFCQFDVGLVMQSKRLPTDNAD
jgi:hypothetical protein